MLTGKQIHETIARRKERERDGWREAQGMLFSSREAEFEWLAERARASLNQGFTVEQLDAEIERSRQKRKVKGQCPGNNISGR